MLAYSDYQIGDKLYESNHSQVYRALRTTDQCPVVLKVLKGDYPSPERVARFKREYQITHSLDLPGVIKAYSLETDQNRWIIVLEDFGGDSLALLGLAGQLSIEAFLSLAIKLVDILGQIHRAHVIHKDVNPSNIILNPQTGQVKLIDFGVSSVLLRENPVFHSPGVLEGTLAYISPEQTGRMNRPVDYRTDFYSLGVTLYELLTGRLPYKSKDPLELVHAHIAKSPTPPHVVRADVPPTLSTLILKLLSKNAQDRYQTSYGLEADLRFCLTNLSDTSNLASFQLGQKDFSGQLYISPKLYGREREIESLTAAFERTSRGQAEMALVVGQAGVGKSSLVYETHKSIAEKHGYFVEGKCGQFQRDIPYYAWIQALTALVNQLLTESQDRLETWKARITGALGDTGRALTDIIPNLTLLIGPQPPLPELGAVEAQNRFHFALQNFIKTVAQDKHPLVIFLDDLQWADAASLTLLDVLLTDPTSNHLLIIGACRDNEVGESHPLVPCLQGLQRARVRVQTIPLGNLLPDDVDRLVEDTLGNSSAGQPTQSVRALSNLVYVKTRGNAFFVHQFLESLYKEGLLRFDVDHRRWDWDVSAIQKRDVTDNVVELMASRTQKLPPDTQAVLKLGACIGNRFDLQTLLAVHSHQTDQRDIADALQPALAEGLIAANLNPTGFDHPEDLRFEYRFAHDRVRQAVYSLISPQDKGQFHLRIGQLLLARLPQSTHQERIFDIVNQLNQGQALLTVPARRTELAELNLQAGQKAKASAAYQAALYYLLNGIELLDAASWQRRYELCLTLHVEAAEAAYLSAQFDQMEELSATVRQRAKTVLDQVKVHQVNIQAYQAQNESRRAVETALSVLELLGTSLPAQPNRLRLLFGFLRTKWALFRKGPEDLLELPEMTDPHAKAAMQILSSLGPAAFRTAPELFALTAFEMLRLSVRHGNSALSTTAYSNYGLILGSMGDLQTGYQFGQLAARLLEQRQDTELRAKTLSVVHGYIKHWKEHFRATLDPLLAAYRHGLESGDFEYAAYSVYMYIGKAYFVGKKLEDLEQEMAAYRLAVQRIEQKIPLYMIKLHHQVVLNLMGQAQDPCRLVGQAYDEDEMLALHVQADDQTALFSLYFHKLALNYLFQAYPQAVDCANRARPTAGSATVSASFFVFHFYDSLAQLAIYADASPPEQKRLLKAVAANQKKMKKWARYAPMNHLHKWHLVEAERARVLGDDKEARAHYDRAIALAQENEYIHEQALAQELAARFHLDRGQPRLAQHYLREAHYAYLQWGARAKVQDLEERYAGMLALEEYAPLHPRLTTPTPDRQMDSLLDLSSILKASQALSSEIVLDKLLVNLMQIVLENAGAERIGLILEDKGQLCVEAIWSVDTAEIMTGQALPIQNSDLVPASIVRYALRIQESLVLHDAANDALFAQDPYVVDKQPKSVLCIPLVHQGKANGVLYLENNLSTDAFTAGRQVLHLLASQAAISIENARLYDTLEQQVAQRTEKLHQSNEQLRQEITDRKRTEDILNQLNLELQARNQELDAFAHSVAHDLKNPLAYIVGFAELLTADDYEALPDEERRRHLQTIARSGRKMSNIIDELLLLSSVRKVEDVPTGPLDMGSILVEVLERLAPMIEGYQAEISLPDPAAWPTGLGYAPWVEEIWVNYLGNALKYGGSPPRIQLGADEGPDQVRYWVRDNGPGLTPEQQARLFTPFTRLQEMRAKGHGLGLSIVKRIAARLGGDVGVESELGRGSLFYFTLPRAQSRSVDLSNE